MTELPETRDSLLMQIKDPQQAAAWEQFVAIYRPAVCRFARRRGLQEADGEDLAQQVMASVAHAIGTWTKDSQRGNFRAWLLRIARNACINAVSRGPVDVARGGTSVAEQLEQMPERTDAFTTLIDEEHHRAIFRWAAEEVRSEFQASTWMAFWLTTIEGHSVEQAASKLNKSVGSVYAARSRVMRRLKEKVREFDEAGLEVKS